MTAGGGGNKLRKSGKRGKHSRKRRNWGKSMLRGETKSEG